MPNALFCSGGADFFVSHVARLLVARGWRGRALERRPGRPRLFQAGDEAAPDDPLLAIHRFASV